MSLVVIDASSSCSTLPTTHATLVADRLKMGDALFAPAHRSVAGARAGTAHEPAWAMFTIQATPNRSVHIPNQSPHGAFSSGTPTVPSAQSLSQ